MMPTALRPQLIAALLGAGLGLPAGAQAAAGPAVSTAPGRIAFSVDGGAVQDDVDAGGGGHAVALPDGSTLVFGSGAGGPSVLYAAKIGLRGTLDGSTSLPAPSGAASGLLQVLRQPDGKLLLVNEKRESPTQFAPGRLQVTRLNADTTIDRSYGAGGTATSGVNIGCGSCTVAALQPDGAVVLTGTTGEIPRTPAPLSLRWAVTRLTASGAVDQAFGAGGVATIATPGSASGFNVAIGAGGAITTEAQLESAGKSTLLLARLKSSGAPDPTFAGGAPVAVPFASGFLLLVQDDGSIVLNGQLAGSPVPTTTPRRQLLARYTAAGAPDPAFGSGGFVDLGPQIEPTQLLAAAGRPVLVVGEKAVALAPGSFPEPGRLNIRLVASNGAIDQGRTVDLPFGGGGSSFLVSIRPRPVASLFQNGFVGNRLVRRADGSYLIPGGVSVSQPTGEGTGFSIGRFAAAALTPALTLDTAFGGPAAPLGLSIRVPRQRATTARSRHGIRVVLKSSAVGLAKVRITAGGRTIAHSLLPVFKTRAHTLPVELTRYGNTYLRRHRHVRVTVRANARDLVASTATATARGRLP